GGWSCIDDCYGLGSCCRVIATGICCIPCSCFSERTTTTSCCYISQQVHGCTTAGIGCCWFSEAWCCSTFYCCIVSCTTNGGWCCIDDCYCLGSCCRVIATCIICIPCSCFSISTSASSCCHVTEQIHRDRVTCIRCSRSSKRWCCRTIDGCISALSTNRWSGDISDYDGLRYRG